MRIAEIHDLLDEHNLAMDERHLCDRVKVLVEQHNKMNETLRKIIKYCVTYPNENPIEDIKACIKEALDE